MTDITAIANTSANWLCSLEVRECLKTVAYDVLKQLTNVSNSHIEMADRDKDPSGLELIMAGVGFGVGIGVGMKLVPILENFIGRIARKIRNVTGEQRGNASRTRRNHRGNANNYIFVRPGSLDEPRPNTPNVHVYLAYCVLAQT